MLALILCFLFAVLKHPGSEAISKTSFVADSPSASYMYGNDFFLLIRNEVWVSSAGRREVCKYCMLLCNGSQLGKHPRTGQG